MSDFADGSIVGVADVVWVRGAQAAAAAPTLLVEVPHGADRLKDFERLRALLVGDLPDDLVAYFLVNTDVGAWDLGLAVARQLVAAEPTRVVVLVRSRIARTFVDCNRLADAPQGDLAAGGLTAGLAPYIRHPDDQSLLLDLHRQYLALVDHWVARVCRADGLVLVPHSYAPRSVGIDVIDDDIGPRLRACWSAEQVERWPLRAPVDLITRTGDGRQWSPAGLVEQVIVAYRELGVQAVEGGTYSLHPSTVAYATSLRHPGRLLCLEVRRDLLVQAWTPFAEMQADPAAVERLAAPLVEGLCMVYASR